MNAGWLLGDTAGVIRAMASLLGAILWPGIVLVLLLTYKPEVKGLLARLRRLTFPGGSADLDPALDRLQKSATAADEAVTAAAPQLVVAASPDLLPPIEPTPRVAVEADEATPPEEGSAPAIEVPSSDETDSGDRVQSILAEAANSPKLGLIALSAEIERKAREVLASSQDASNWEGRPLSYTLSRLELAPSVRRAVEEFRDVRDKIVHGFKATDDDALRAIDSGVTILRALDGIPREVHVVYEPSVDIYADADGSQERTDVHGVVLETSSSDGTTQRRVFPTTRSHFQRGKPVAWEWNLQRSWPESWYRDPDRGDVQYGWSSSAEFIGRHLEDI